MTIALGELTNEQRLTLLEQRVLHIESAIGDALEGPGVVPRVLFCSPVTGKIEAAANPFGGLWFDAVGYGKLYDSSSNTKAYHTGADLNLPAWKDSGSPVYAAADGEIVFAGKIAGWQGQVVIIKHTLEDGKLIWTRYAHIRDVPTVGMVRVDVKRGEQIGVIADYLPIGAVNDHLHFDVAHDDLGTRPGDWPGMDKQRVLAQYLDPLTWLKDRAK
jgi:murein DD-endopeptidase MepM/ murein hydrolase activator NlpD